MLAEGCHLEGKKVYAVLCPSDPEGVDLDLYPIHVLTATLKAFFRDMPEPLMTFELYDSYLLATSKCTVQCVSHSSNVCKSSETMNLLFHCAVQMLNVQCFLNLESLEV